MRTSLCRLLGIRVPIVQAPMSGAVGPALAAAVSNAGGLGTIAPWGMDPDAVRSQIRQTQSLTDRPFAVNLNLEFPQVERLEICLQERVPIISFFWRDPEDLVQRAKDGGAIVMHSVGTARDAERAARAGVDVVVAQGWEAGGHVRGRTATMALVPAVVDAVAPVPVVAAGGIADGRGIAAALCLGAEGVWIGTRFLMSHEATIHPEYRERLIQASEDDTIHLDNLFDGGWPDASHRVLRNSTIDAWERAGRPRAGERPGEGETVAVSRSRGPIVRYRSYTPAPDAEGDIEALSMWAGQGVGLVKAAASAAQIVAALEAETEAALQRVGGAPHPP